MDNNNIVNVFHTHIKQESDDGTKVECVVEGLDDLYKEIKKENNIIDTVDLYKDHVVKEELVIGLEVIQEFSTSVSYKTHADCKIEKIKLENGAIDVDVNKINKNVYTCDYCKKTYKNKVNLNNHIQKHFQKTKNMCKVCGKSFSFIQNLFRHQKIHSGTKSYECPHCGKSYGRADYLKQHIKFQHPHSKPPCKEQKSTCDLCHKEFARKYSRDHHMKYSCPRNKNKMELKRDKLYVCDVCDNSYRYRSSLSAHIVIRHMGKAKNILHECDYCSKKYVKKHNLQCHMLSRHMKKKPYVCKICKEGFNWHTTLAMHERKVHGKVKRKIV